MMMKKLIAAGLMCLSLLPACEDKEKSSSAKPLTVATSADYPPFEFFKDGEITGFDIDLIKKIAHKLNRSVEIKDMSFDGIVGALQTNRVDAAISSLTPTPERLKVVDFSEIYHNANRVLVCRVELDINSANDLDGKTIGVQLGSTHETYAQTELREVQPSIEIRSLNKIPDLVQDMKAGRISCLALGKTEAEEIAKAHAGLKVLPLSGADAGIAIALPLGSPLTAEINKILKELEADGTISALKKKWLEAQ